MQIMIHATPGRMWYVTGYLVPELRLQGADSIVVWCDNEGLGNLQACRASLASIETNGDTWHLQDDVLPCADFLKTARSMEAFPGVVCGFVSEVAGPDANLTGAQRGADLWYSFPCIRIPDGRARAFAAWIRDGGDKGDEAADFIRKGNGDDWFFKRFMEMYHADETVWHCKPCMVEHVDFYLGGSIVTPWRGYWARAAWWDDENRVQELKKWVKTHRP